MSDDWFFEPNPFAAETIRAGVEPFVFPPGITSQSLWTKFAEGGWLGQIVGPHGSGKTTLVRTLLQHPPWSKVLAEVYVCKARSCKLVECRAAAEGDSFCKVVKGCLRTRGGKLIVIDGAEQIPMMVRSMILALAMLRGIKLLVTSHKEFRHFSTLLHLKPTFPLAWELVSARLERARQWRAACGLPGVDLNEDVVRVIFEKHRGNIREMLFELYDIYESLSKGQQVI